MKHIKTFLETKGIKIEHVIYNMNNPTSPRIDLPQLLIDYEIYKKYQVEETTIVQDAIIEVQMEHQKKRK